MQSWENLSFLDFFSLSFLIVFLASFPGFLDFVDFSLVSFFFFPLDFDELEDDEEEELASRQENNLSIDSSCSSSSASSTRVRNCRRSCARAVNVCH